MDKPDYIYSQLAENSVCQLLALQYDLDGVINCQFYVLGLHDNYLIECENRKYILRIYRNNWRSEQEIQFELELLAFLGKKHAPVAEPLPNKTGGLSFFINSPEGQRVAALFNYADGYAPGNDITLEQSTLLGKTVANVHQMTETFKTQYARQVLDIPYLLDKSIIALQGFIDQASLDYLHALQIKLKNRLPPLPQDTGIFGICMGDINPSNFHINERNKITLFDFDQCGYAYRSFEIGKFISSIHNIKTKHEISEAFIDGYQTVRKLSEEELFSIPCYELVSVIWVMAIHAYNVDRIGHKYLQKSFWDRRLAILNDLEMQLPGKLI